VVFPFPQIYGVVYDAVRFLTQASRRVLQCQPWLDPRLFAYRFFWRTGSDIPVWSSLANGWGSTGWLK